MIKSLFFLWNKDIMLRLTLIVIACIMVAAAFLEKDSTGASLISMILVFAAGILSVNDRISGSKNQVQLCVSPVGRDRYILIKFLWADMWTFMFFVFTAVVSVSAAWILGKEIDAALVSLPFIALLFAMLVNCVSVPCICLLSRRMGAVIETVFVFGILFLMGILSDFLAQEENVLMSFVSFYLGLNLIKHLLLAIFGAILCTAMQWLTWSCLRKAHLK